MIIFYSCVHNANNLYQLLHNCYEFLFLKLYRKCITDNFYKVFLSIYITDIVITVMAE